MKGIDLFVKILSQGRILTNKFGLFARILVCLSEFWFVCQNFGLFVSILVCLPLCAKVIWKKNVHHLNMTGFQIDT